MFADWPKNKSLLLLSYLPFQVHFKIKRFAPQLTSRPGTDSLSLIQRKMQRHTKMKYFSPCVWSHTSRFPCPKKTKPHLQEPAIPHRLPSISTCHMSYYPPFLWLLSLFSFSPLLSPCFHSLLSFISSRGLIHFSWSLSLSEGNSTSIKNTCTPVTSI